MIVVYYFLLPGFICIATCCLYLFLLFFLWYPTPDYHCSVVGPVSTVCDGSWICCSCCCYLILPAFLLCLGSPYFVHLLSCLLVVAFCHIKFSPFLSSLCSHFVVKICLEGSMCKNCSRAVFATCSLGVYGFYRSLRNMGLYF